MPLRPLLQTTLAALLVAVPLLASPAAQAAVFSLTLAGIPLGTVTLDGRQEGAAYEAVSKITPNGLVDLVAGYGYDGRATGAVDPEGKIVPERFEADSTSPRATRRTEIAWRDGKPVEVSVVPPRQSPADPAAVSDALDPVSAGFALLRDNAPDKVCDMSVEVFDGSRRSRLTLGAPRLEEAGGVLCNGEYARLEGEAHSLSEQGEYPFTLHFTPGADGQVRLERIETRTRFGLAVVTRRD